MSAALALFDLGFASARLALDAQDVIALRLAKLALGGPEAEREASLMVSEKYKAFADSQWLIVRAALRGNAERAPASVVGLYGRRVRANKRRLRNR
ncbi:MAG: hypothetical protein JOZ58_18130 [Acetobacteraceae bacterium]|nr:hypothetical protein [Acetobacteraceae bacterium]